MTIETNDTTFDQCIKCTVCTVYCPVAKVNSDFPGPKQCGPDGERLRIKSAEFYDDRLNDCTNCKRCETACPSGVRIGDIIAVARGRYGKRSLSPTLIRDYLLSHTDLCGTLATPIAPVINAITTLPMVKHLMHHTIGIPRQKTLPQYTRETFRHWYHQHVPEQSRFPRQISYFHGCYVNYNYPQLGKDLIRVMNAMQIGVQLLEREKCCGVPMIANGFHDQARHNAQFNLKYIEQAIRHHSVAIVATSSTCAFTLQEEYPHVLGIDNQHVVDHIQYITRFLVREMLNGNMPKLHPINKTVVYHTPCHLERSGDAIFTLELLKRIPGLNVIILDSTCCGLAGTYGFKREHYATSLAIGQPLFDAINTANADYVITDCETCKWQIEENTPLRCQHPISVLATAITD